MASFAALAGGLIVLLALTLALFGVPVLEGLRLLAVGAFGDRFAVARTLLKFSPVVLTSLGMAIAWRAKMYNIGGEGQYIMGALYAAALFKFWPGAPSFWLTVLLVLTCIGGGAIYAGIAAWLFVRRNVNLVISTILLNFIALQVLNWAVSGPLQRAKADIPSTERLPEAVRLLRLDPQTDLHLGVGFGFVAAIGLAIYLFRTFAGFRLRVTGESPFAARAAGYRVKRIQMGAMLLSGGLCGLAAASEYLGAAGAVDRGFSQNWGFLGIPVALVGNTHPIGVLLSALFFSGLFAGSENLARFTTGGPTLLYVMQGVAVLALVAVRAPSIRFRSMEAQT